LLQIIFLVGAILGPLIVLTADISKSAVVGGIVGVPVALLVVAVSAGVAPKPDQREPFLIRRLFVVDIVLLHDADHKVLEGDRRHTVAALEYWLPRWRDAGLRFVAIDDFVASATASE
jgi:hypothetical protein